MSAFLLTNCGKKNSDSSGDSDNSVTVAIDGSWVSSCFQMGGPTYAVMTFVVSYGNNSGDGASEANRPTDIDTTFALNKQ